jgi:cytochrome c biogenesis protein CcmG, thiol:disulfide interchange protein DsbE
MSETTQTPRRGLGYLIPIGLFLVVAVFLGVGLLLNPRIIPSALIDKPVPNFNLPPIDASSPGLSSEDLKGKVQVVNVFASWCGPCRVEHPLLMELKRRGIAPLHALNYKDSPANARAFLAETGDPYTRIGADRDGRVGIEFGVYGVPETFVIDTEGRIAFKHVGPLMPWDVENKLLPAIEKAKAK